VFACSTFWYNLQIGSAPRPYPEPDLNGNAMNANWFDG